jgi:hypothetical protein
MEETENTVAPKAPATSKAAKPKPKKKAAPTRQAQAEPAKVQSPDRSTLNDGDPTEKTRKLLHGEKKVTVRINSTEQDKDDVFVAVNGYPYTIKRDVDVEIPFSVYQTLVDAKSTVYRQVKREDGEGMHMIETEIQRFSMSARF